MTLRVTGRAPSARGTTGEPGTHMKNSPQEILQHRRCDFPARLAGGFSSSFAAILPSPIASPLLHVPKARFTASKRRLSSLLVLSATLRTEPRQEFSPCQSMSKKMSVQFSRCQCRRSAMLLPFGETAQEAVRLGAVRPVKCCYAAGSATQSVA